MKKSKLLALILAGCIAVSSLTACGAASGTSAGGSAPASGSVSAADGVSHLKIMGTEGWAPCTDWNEVGEYSAFKTLQGWLDEAKRYFETACQMDPENPEYRQALAAFNNRGYRPQGYQTVSTSCGNDVCSNWCLAALCCNLLGGGGYFCLPCMF